MRSFLDFYPKEYLHKYLGSIIFMNEDKKWMLITYYCPTHGDAGKVEPIELTRQEISNNLFEKNRFKKDIEYL